MKREKLKADLIERLRFARRVCTVVFVLLLSACATTDYTTHYGIFTAENSVGEVRQFRAYWQTLRYEGWLENTYRALPLVLETQCSKRKVRFYDASFGSGRRCAGASEEGIQFCSRSNLDVDRKGRPIENNRLCGTVTDRQGSKDLLNLEGDLLITISCRPTIAERTVKGTKINTDYLLGSEIPYVVSTKPVKGSNVDLIIPELSSHSSICDPDA